MSIYTDQGYEDRNDYLKCLAEDNEVDINTVEALAGMLGPTEDFDGLVTSIEDYAMSM